MSQDVVLWTSYSDPNTLVNVGNEAICMLCDNILCFTDLKTKEIQYYKAESPEMGMSVSCLAGHNVFRMVAFAEVVLQPSVFILKYPSFDKYAVFPCKNMVHIVDLLFSEHDILLGMSGFPHYTLCVWNFRTGHLLVQIDTLRESLAYSLYCSSHHIPVIVQYSEWTKTIFVWEMCFSATEVDIHEISRIQLSQDHTFSNQFALCFTEDNSLYCIDDYGAVSVVEIALFYLKPEWVPERRDNTEPTPHRLYSHRQGLIVQNKKKIFYIKKKANSWYMEWKIKNPLVPENIERIVTNGTGEIYAATVVGNTYIVDVEAILQSMASVVTAVMPVGATKIPSLEPEVTLKELNKQNTNYINFVILKGTQEECMIGLTKDSLKAIEISRREEYSCVKITNGCTLAAHNTGPYAVVGTSNGQLHFISYANCKLPQVLMLLATDQAYAIRHIELFGDLGVYCNIYQDFHLLRVDFETLKFFDIAPLKPLQDECVADVCKYFLAPQANMFFFIDCSGKDTQRHDTDNSIPALPLANELWLLHWKQKMKQLEHFCYKLPYTYRDICHIHDGNISEFYGVRTNTNFIDIFHFPLDIKELQHIQTIQTHHLSNIHGIIGTHNLITWGVHGTHMHYRSNRKSSKPYEIYQHLQIKYHPRVVKKSCDSCNGKNFLGICESYMVYLYSTSGIMVRTIPSDNAVGGIRMMENIFIETTQQTIEPYEHKLSEIERQGDADKIIIRTPEELQVREELLKQFNALSDELTQLINFDMEVTGKTQGIFRKFCLNHNWLQSLTSEAEKLCQVERQSMMAATEDQMRVRNWIYNLLLCSNQGITFKIRALFSKYSFENYGYRVKDDVNFSVFDLYRFYEMEPDEEEGEDEGIEDNYGNEDAEGKGDGLRLDKLRQRKYFVVNGSPYEHVISDELAMQDTNMVTSNQMYNQDAKYRLLLIDTLKEEFNKKFNETRKIKMEMMQAVAGINTNLETIYSNMNCMLCLLEQPKYQAPELSRPQWHVDEIVERIMEVDDSEIKAINRRKKKAEVIAAKRGRLLLWSFEFWAQALMTMMDGVLEKLWEEEIKKEIPVPEFMLKKDPTEYTLEDQKQLREYDEKVRILLEDRKKYLRILSENEEKTIEIKDNYIKKLNEQVTEMMIVKLKYDFAIKHVRLRSLSTKVMYFKRLEWIKRLGMLREDLDTINEYIAKYAKLAEFWQTSAEDVRAKLETLLQKDKSIEKQFKSQYLNSIPAHCSSEMNKLFKRRPKQMPQLLQSAILCRELTARIGAKTIPKYEFPLPRYVFEYLDGLKALDDIGNLPVILEAKYWEPFVKLRRQKMESEWRIKAINLQLADSTGGMNSYTKELQDLKNTKLEAIRQMEEAQREYLKSVQNQTLELRMTMGQIETNILGSLQNLSNCVLMHQDDIHDINALILKAGHMKLKAMHRVAFFRRQVIFREWEHKVVSANIEYLKNMLNIIGKCKVSMEFLNILRNWDKVQHEKKKLLATPSIIEKICEEKQLAFRRNIEKMNSKISKVREQLDEIKRANHRVNRQIDDVRVDVAFSSTARDFMMEEKRQREQNERMEKIKMHGILVNTVKSDYAHLLELKTILELQRLRTYPTLGPRPSDCPTYYEIKQ